MMVARSWGEGKMVSYSSMGIKFWFSKRKRFLRATEQHCICGQQSYAVLFKVSYEGRSHVKCSFHNKIKIRISKQINK